MEQALKRPKGRRTQAAKPRLGPRPLPLHLGLALLAWQSSKAAWPLWKDGSLPWKADLAEAADALRRDLAGSAPDAFEGALGREVERRHASLLNGIEAYRSHPYRRTLKDPPAVWQEGGSRLLDYRAARPPEGGNGEAPLLVVPSLINRAYILDLNAKASLLRWLAGRGFAPFLLDWGAPGPDERGYGLSDYVAGRLERALDHLLALCGRRPQVIGYCMGGLLALALASRRGGDLTSLALLAAPWDFHADHPAQARLVGRSLLALEPLMAMAGARVPGSPHTIFQVLNHMVYWQDISLGRMREEQPPEPPTAAEGWVYPAAPEDESDWEALVACFVEGLRAVEERVANPEVDLDRVVDPATTARPSSRS